MNKQKITRIIQVSLLIIAITAGTVIALSIFVDNNPDKKDIKNTATSAEALQIQAQQATKNNEIVKAKDLLQRARRVYVDTKNLDGVANTDAQLYLLDHPRP